MRFFDSVFPSFTFISSAVTMVLGFCFLFVQVPKSDLLTNYRISRKILAVSYFILSISNILALYLDKDLSNPKVTLYATLIASAFQAFLFTFAIITLINNRFLKRKFIFSETLPLLGFTLLLGLSVVFKWVAIEKTTYIIFCIYYASRLGFYTFLYFREERLYHSKIERSFFNHETKRLLWVRTTFIGALIIGILALLSQIFMEQLFMMIFTMIYVVFYSYFAIKYINYVHVFHIAPPSQVFFAEKTTAIHEEHIQKMLKQWVQDKGFCIPDLTISELAASFNTNRTYLSSYINQKKQMNFNAWINYLRIDYAKKLLLEDHTLLLGEVGEIVGYKEQGSFTRQFAKIEGISPLLWRKNTIKKHLIL